MTTIPPQTYILEWSSSGGFLCKHVNVVQLLQTATSEPQPSSPLVSLSSPTSTLVSPSFRATATDEKSISKTSRVSASGTAVNGGIVYHIRHLKWYSKSYELIRGAPEGESGTGVTGEKSGYGARVEAGGKVMDIEQEGCHGHTSTYTYVAGAGANANAIAAMSKRKGPGGEPFWSCNRSFDDFDGVHYKIETTFFCDFTITRTDDGVPVARFIRTKFSWSELGKLTILVPTPPALLHLLLSTTHMKYLQDRKRRREMGSA
ncbi:hypothetical protein FRB96_009419 [Tulasnella sp. 330]|nr:hypothetical protein FRB96_009419 [Tulasnella sp. 330]